MLTVEIDPKTLSTFERTLREYTQLNQADDAFLVEKQMAKTMHNARKAYRQDAATVAKINQDTAGHIYLYQNRGGGKRALVFAPPKSQIRKAILAKRKAARGYLAATFIFPGWRPTPKDKLQESIKRIKPKVKSRSIHLTLHARKHSPEMRWQSLIPGVVEIAKKNKYFEKAVRETIQDMKVYITRKRLKNLQRARR